MSGLNLNFALLGCSEKIYSNGSVDGILASSKGDIDTDENPNRDEIHAVGTATTTDTLPLPLV